MTLEDLKQGIKTTLVKRFQEFNLKFKRFVKKGNNRQYLIMSGMLFVLIITTVLINSILNVINDYKRTHKENIVINTTINPQTKITGDIIETIDYESPIDILSGNELIFDINATYDGNGIINSKISTNIYNKEISADFYSFKDMYPDEEIVNGINFKRLYLSILDLLDKDYIPDGKYLEGPNSKGISDIRMDNKGNNSKTFVIYSSVIQSYKDSEEEKLKQSSNVGDNIIAQYLKNKKTFQNDKRIKLVYTIPPILLSKLDLSMIKLPNQCKKNSYKGYNDILTNEIICEKDIIYDKTKDYKVNVGDNRKCMYRVGNLCISHIDNQGYHTLEDSIGICKDNDSRLPIKGELKGIEQELSKIFNGTPISHIQTSTQEDSIYSWVEGIYNDSSKENYYSNRATSNSQKRNYVGIICLK